MARNIDSVTERRAASDTDLRGEATIFSNDNVVCDLDEIIQFGAAFNQRFSKCRSINSSIRSNFNIVFNDHGSDLGDFVVSVANGCESEAVAANNCAAVDDHPVADGYLFSDTDMWIDKTISADLGSFADVDKGLNNGIISNFNVVSDIGKRLDATRSPSLTFFPKIAVS